MELNELTIVLIAILVIAIIVFLIWRNYKDKKAFNRRLIDGEESAITKAHDTEVNAED